MIRVMIAGGFVFLCAASPPPLKSASTLPNHTSPPDLLEGLTLTNDQKAKIDQIREDTKSRLAAVANKKALSPEVANALRRGYYRTENSEILEVLTPGQQAEVHKKMTAWRAAQPNEAGRQLGGPPTN